MMIKLQGARALAAAAAAAAPDDEDEGSDSVSDSENEAERPQPAPAPVSEGSPLRSTESYEVAKPVGMVRERFPFMPFQSGLFTPGFHSQSGVKNGLSYRNGESRRRERTGVSWMAATRWRKAHPPMLPARPMPTPLVWAWACFRKRSTRSARMRKRTTTARLPRSRRRRRCPRTSWTRRTQVRGRFRMISLRNCLFTPELQWQSRGERRILQGCNGARSGQQPRLGSAPC